MNKIIKDLISRIDDSAALPEDSPDERVRKTLLVFLCACGAALGLCGALAFRSMGMETPAAAVLAYSGLSAAALAHLRWTRKPAWALRIQLLSLLLVPVIVQWTAGGFSASGGAALWALLCPLCAVAFQGARGSVPWFAAYAVLILLASSLDRALLAAENVLLVSTVAFIAMRYFSDEREKAQAALKEKHRLLVAEQERSERLLLNILPAPIAERLKGGEGAIADGFAEASILFADIAGFTPFSHGVPPQELVGMLNKFFSRFDTLAEKHGVEKIKTIGDAYMVCAGLPIPRADHAQALAEMALDMREAVAECNRELGTSLSLRIGINSGPVVAGVIGLKKFVYDLWGDTVNAASRMESHGLPGRIQVTEATRELLKGRYELEARGPLDIKGLGRMTTYILKGRR
ncbi:MAG: adenylate/guanylate cyclase domain-containing protein [Elusimicrobiota bacterium]